MTTILPLEQNYTSTIMVYIQSNIQKSVIISLRIQHSWEMLQKYFLILQGTIIME